MRSRIGLAANHGCWIRVRRPRILRTDLSTLIIGNNTLQGRFASACLELTPGAITYERLKAPMGKIPDDETSSQEITLHAAPEIPAAVVAATGQMDRECRRSATADSPVQGRYASLFTLSAANRADSTSIGFGAVDHSSGCRPRLSLTCVSAHSRVGNFSIRLKCR